MPTLAEAAFAFNKDQVRGPDGKWIRVGAMVKSEAHGTGTVTKVDKATGKVNVRFEDPDSDTGDSVKTVSASTLKAAPPLPKLTPAQKKARTKRLDDGNDF